MNTSIHTLNQKSPLSASMKRLLLHWYSQKFIYKRNTSELMKTTCDARNRNALSIVALLDVEPALMVGLMDSKTLEFVQTCHAYLISAVLGNALIKEDLYIAEHTSV
ncbi:hypothetical protein [Marinobacter sp.]|uniref:hypothetical protein n=1 Tax=Marinobacter sp. TaxID=50741 RepID=UPI003A907300